MNTEFSTVTLNDGFRMPVLGLGVYKALGEGEVNGRSPMPSTPVTG